MHSQTEWVVPEYEEDIVQPQDYAKNLVRSPVKRSVSYFKNLFPIINWLPYYPTQPRWIASDFITGVSVAIVLVPQAMSYAKLAGLQPEYGLYSSFIGLMMYALFATSKDVSIGPVAVMSLEVSKIINRVQESYPDVYTAPQIATTLALLCGAITLGVGLLKLGFLVELIPLPAVMAFTTGSAFSIIVGQLPGLMGFSSEVNTREASYKIVIGFLKHLPDTTIDAAFGLVGLFILYVWKYVTQRMIDKYTKLKDKKRQLTWIYMANLRTAIVIIFSTLISFLIIRRHKDESSFGVIGEIKSGLSDLGVFKPPAKLAARIAPDLPVATIVLVLEHISIAKSFGRIHDYKIDSNQEFIAIGVTNLVGTFFGAYPATGSFSRTALSSKCGVKTPFASIFAGFCVLLAIYCFTSAFYYIPKATLCAIIIHAVSDLLASYKSTWRLYLIQPLDCGIFLVGVFISVFASIEIAIYWAMCSSAALIIWRMCWTNGNFLGRMKVVEVVNPVLVQSLNEESNKDQSFINSGLLSMADSYISMNSCAKFRETSECVESVHSSDSKNNKLMITNYKWIPLPNEPLNSSSIHTRYANSKILVEKPPNGVVVYRMSESFVYPNASAQTDRIIDYVKREFRSSNTQRELMWNCISEQKELNWNLKFMNPVNWKFSNSSKAHADEELGDITYLDNDNYEIDGDNDITIGKPEFKLLHLDFSQVVAVDATSIQALTDMRRAIELYTGSSFEIHFSGIINPWVIHSLVNAGFASNEEHHEIKDRLNKSKKNREGSSSSVDSPQSSSTANGNGAESFSSADNETGTEFTNQNEHEIEINIEEDRFNEFENERLAALKKSAYQKNHYITTALSDDGLLYPVYGTNLPNFHLDIPSYANI